MAKKKGEKQKKQSNVSSQKSQARNALGPSDDANSYTGSIMPIERVRGTDEFVRLLVDYGTVSATAGGVYNTVHSSLPTSMTQWANMIGNVDQYRVLAMEFVYVPINQLNQTLSVAYGAGVGPFMTCLDYNSVTAIASAQSAVEFSSCIMHAASEKITRSIRATGKELMAWVDTNNSPTTLMSIKTYSDTNFASIRMGSYLIRRLIQFRSTV